MLISIIFVIINYGFGVVYYDIFSIIVFIYVHNVVPYTLSHHDVNCYFDYYVTNEIHRVVQIIMIVYNHHELKPNFQVFRKTTNSFMATMYFSVVDNFVALINKDDVCHMVNYVC